NDEPSSVTAIGGADKDTGDLEAAAILTLKFRRGTLATVLVSTRVQYRTPMEFVGDAGVLRADDGLTVDRPVTLELWQRQAIVSTETVSNQLAYAKQVDSFAAALEGKQTFPVPGEEGWQNQLILDAAYRSLWSAKSEPIEILESGVAAQIPS